MNSMTKTIVCPKTGQDLQRDVRPLKLARAGRSVVVDMPGWYGSEGTQSLHSVADIETSEKALNNEKGRGLTTKQYNQIQSITLPLAALLMIVSTAALIWA